MEDNLITSSYFFCGCLALAKREDGRGLKLVATTLERNLTNHKR